eukprot:g6304.t1
MGICDSKIKTQSDEKKDMDLKSETKKMTPLEASLLKAEKRAFDVSSDSLEGRALRRWSVTHKKKFEEEEAERRRSSVTKLARRVSSNVRRASSTVLGYISGPSNTSPKKTSPDDDDECGFPDG